MFTSVISALSLALSLLLGGAPMLSTDTPAQSVDQQVTAGSVDNAQQ